jgi:anti-sigma-K factor RskA
LNDSFSPWRRKYSDPVRCYASVRLLDTLEHTAKRALVQLPQWLASDDTQTPPQLRERVLAAVARTRQLPPATDQRPVPKPRSVWLPRLAAAAAAVAAVVAIVLGVTQSATQSKLDRVQAREQAIAAVLNAPDVRIASHRTSVGGTATVVFSEVSHKMMVTTAGLPPLPASKVYQLWLIAPGNIRSAGLLPAPAGGRTAPVLAAGLAAGDRAGVTVEPAGGSRQPTTTPIIAIPLAG